MKILGICLALLVVLLCGTPSAMAEPTSAYTDWSLLTQPGDIVEGHCLSDIWASAPDDVYVVGYSCGSPESPSDGFVAHFDGVQWRYVLNRFGTSNSQIWGNGPDDVFATNGSTSVLHYDGTEWKRLPTGSPENLYGIWGSGPNDVYAVGFQTTIVHYDGSDWTVAYERTGSDPYNVNLDAAWGSGPDDVFTVGTDDTILHYDGATWTRMQTGSYYPQTFYGVWGSGPDDVYTIGAQAIMHFDGEAWDFAVKGNDSFSLTDVWGSGGDDVYVLNSAGGAEGVIHFNGECWLHESLDKRLVKGLWGAGTDNVYVVASDAVLRSDGIQSHHCLFLPSTVRTQ